MRDELCIPGEHHVQAGNEKDISSEKCVIVKNWAIKMPLGAVLDVFSAASRTVRRKET